MKSMSKSTVRTAKVKARKPTAKPAAGKRKATAKSVRKSSAKRSANAMFLKAMTPAAMLAAVLGTGSATSSQATKRLSNYVNRRDLPEERPRNVLVPTSELPKSKIASADVTVALSKLRSSKLI